MLIIIFRSYIQVLINELRYEEILIMGKDERGHRKFVSEGLACQQVMDELKSKQCCFNLIRYHRKSEKVLL